jgi:dethiobiotin synthetase
MQRSFFVTGTDTDAGKTVITTGFIDLLTQSGLRVAGMKPVASGCVMTDAGLRNDDALQHQAHSNVDLPYTLINPYAFLPAIAPHIAAEHVQVSIDLDLLQDRFNQIQREVDVVVVEGAGGWFVPLNTTQTIADLAIQLQLPVILVVGIKLGCINHALLSVQAIQQSGLTLLGWVANTVEINDESDAIISSLKQRINEPCLGVVPTLGPNQSAAAYLSLEGI